MLQRVVEMHSGRLLEHAELTWPASSAVGERV
jgi:hypothetical protein